MRFLFRLGGLRFSGSRLEVGDHLIGNGLFYRAGVTFNLDIEILGKQFNHCGIADAQDF